MKPDDKKMSIIERALHRAMWTAGETLLGFMSVGMTVQEVDWKTALSVTALAVIISVIKSFLVGMPEVEDEEER